MKKTIAEAALEIAKNVYMSSADITKKILKEKSKSTRLGETGKTPFRTVNGILQRLVKKEKMTRILVWIGKNIYVYKTKP